MKIGIVGTGNISTRHLEEFNKTLSLIKPKNLFGEKEGLNPDELIEFVTDNAKINILKSSKFIAVELDNDKDNLIAFYQSKGYRDIKIVEEDVRGSRIQFVVLPTGEDLAIFLSSLREQIASI